MAKNKNNEAIWSKRIKKNPSKLFQEIGGSIDIDKRLFKEDILASSVHVEMLAKQKIISVKVKKKILGKDTKYRLGLDVDASGMTLEGKSFKDVNDFRKILLNDKKSLAKNITNKLLVFGTAAQVHFNDRQVVNTIVENSRSKDFGIRSIIHEIVQSKIFRRK